MGPSQSGSSYSGPPWPLRVAAPAVSRASNAAKGPGASERGGEAGAAVVETAAATGSAAGSAAGLRRRRRLAGGPVPGGRTRLPWGNYEVGIKKKCEEMRREVLKQCEKFAIISRVGKNGRMGEILIQQLLGIYGNETKFHLCPLSGLIFSNFIRQNLMPSKPQMET